MFSKKRSQSVTTTTITTTTRPVGATRPGVKTTTTTTRVQVVQRNLAPPPTATTSSKPKLPPTVVKRPIAPPAPPPAPPRVNALKRKAEALPPPPKKVSSVKSSKSEGKKKVAPPLRKKKVESSSEEEEEESSSEGESDSSEDGSLSLFGRKEGTPMVERSVAASLDGDVKCISGEELVLANRKAYVDWFVDPQGRPTVEWAGSEIPTIELEYPGKDGKERFALLTSKNGNEYDPIEDLLEAIRTVLDVFLTPAQSSSLFGHSSSADSFGSFLSAPSSRSATPADSPGPSTLPATPLMRALERAKLKKDGPTFMSEIARYNAGIRALKDEGKMEENIKALKGLKQKTWEKVTAQAYERTVGPEIEELSNYPAFSDNVYGELLPKFMDEIFQKAQLGPDSVFVDLGSGVGNCVVQAALATGCEAWGFESMPHASSLARRQVVEAEARFRMWGLSSGEMHTVEADFCEHPQVGEVLRRADVILVNNEVFRADTNERLSLMFLELRNSTRIVSLKAFATSSTLSDYNRDSPLAILRQGPELRYPRNSVSWKSEAGTYFIGKIDRDLLRKFSEREEKRAAKKAARATGGSA